MKENIFNKYTYEYQFPRNNLRKSELLNNNYEENINYNKYNNYISKYNDIENKSLRNDYNENNMNNKSLILMNEIESLKRKYNIAKEKLELAKSQKEKDDIYIENLENQLNKKYSNNNNIYENMNYRKIPINNSIYKNDNIKNKYLNRNDIYNNYIDKTYFDYSKIKNNQSNILEYTIFDNYNNFQNNHKNITSNNFRYKSNLNFKKDIPLRNDSKLFLKRNNSTIFNSKKDETIKTKKFSDNLEKINNDFFSLNLSSINNENNNKNKLIIRNCNCIINLNPEDIQKNNYLLQKLFPSLYDNPTKIDNSQKKNNQKIEEQKIMEERYLIIDEKQKPIYVNGKQLLGMKLKILRGDKNEIISDNEKNIFLYDLDGALHNQKDLKKVILENGMPLVNENNMPILGINNIPVIDQFGDFLLGKKLLIDKDSNYKKGLFADVLRDKEGKPIKILIEKNMSGEIKNVKNNLFNNNTKSQDKNNSKDQSKIKKSNSVVEIEIKPYTKLIANKENNFYEYLKNYKKKITKSPINDKKKISFEKSLRNYLPKYSIKKKMK